MPAVVAISDLHLGEESSLVNPLLRKAVPPILADRKEFKNPPVNTTPQKLNNMLQKITRNSKGISDLVLVGDIIDLSLSTYSNCVLQAREFFRQLLAGILPGALVWVPGNHDHHIWVQVCEEEYIEAPMRESRLPIEFSPISGAGKGTGAMNRYNKGVQFLLGLLPYHVRDRFWVAYPNYVTTCDDENLLFHHGHFFDKKISWIGTSLIEAQSLSELEMFNSSYLDFIWYGSGQSGRLSEQIENFYEEILWAYERIGIVLDLIDIKKFFKWLLGRYKKGGDRDVKLDSKMADRIAKYFRYIDKEREVDPAAYPVEFKLVFGHTHRPLAGGRVGNHGVFNAGGWAADELWPGADNLTTGIFIGSPGRPFTVEILDIDREIYDFCHNLNHAYREAVKIDLGAPC